LERPLKTSSQNSECAGVMSGSSRWATRETCPATCIIRAASTGCASSA
jgi:hypothetical protein